MKRLLCFTVVISVCLIFCSLYVSATVYEEYYTYLVIPEDVGSLLDEKEAPAILSFTEVFEYILKKIKTSIYEPLTMTITLFVILVISSLYHKLAHLLQKNKMEAAFNFVINIVCAFSIMYLGYDCISISEKFVKQIADFSASLSPVISAVCLSSGKPNSSMVMGAGVSLFSGLCEGAFVLFLFPLIKVILILGSVANINDDIADIKGMLLIAKKIFATILGFIVMLYTCVLSAQKMSAGAIDSVSFRSVRFAISSLVPVVGASLGEASRSVATSLGVLRESIGGVGISVVLLLTVPCAIRIIINRLFLYGCAAIARFLSCRKEADMLENVASAWGYCLSLVLCSSFMLIFVLAVFSRISVGV